MPLPEVVILSVLHGLTEALPLSASAHASTARLFVDGPVSPVLLALPELGAAFGLALAARKRLIAVLRAFAHPERFGTSPDARDAAVLTVATGVSLTVALLLGPRAELWGEPPAATGLGLLLTGLALASTALAGSALAGAPGEGQGARGSLRARSGATRRPRSPRPRWWGSRMGSPCCPAPRGWAPRSCSCCGWACARGRAVDLALLLTVPALLLRVVQGLFRAGGSGLGSGTLATAWLFAFLAAFVAAAIVRRLSERRRVGVLALWLVPLGLALLAYARALPGPGA
jgi:undecaprenyl-diphosphatase